MNRFIDYHIHTSWSDGYRTPEEIIEAAIAKELHEICITDHYSHFKPALMEADLFLYFKTINELKDQFKSSIKIFIGIEVDMTSIQDLKPIENIEWDLVLFEYVFNTNKWQDYFKEACRYAKATQIQSGLAHTRFSRVTEQKFDSVLRKLIDNNIAIELNTGYHNFRDKWFKSLDAEFLFSIGSDAHDIIKLGDISTAYYFLESQKIPQERIISL